MELSPRVTMCVLVVNAGSSSLKLRVLGSDDQVVARADLAVARDPFSRDEVGRWIRGCGAMDAIGHRVVHGGAAFGTAVRIDSEVERRLGALTDLAPLHRPALEMIALVRDVLPGVPAVACFDTAFHASLPAAAATYALPLEWRKRWSLRRYGFHGLSHAYASRQVAERLARPAGLRVVTCHLGAGASLAAVVDGRSCDTTMGFTPLDGLVMATRPGSLDPGLVLWLEEHAGLAARELAETFEHRSGLLALAGTADMREILAGAEQGRPECALALDVYIRSLRAGVAAMAAAMNGMDALVFTGGVGENAPGVRSGAAAGLGFLGIALDELRNGTGEGDRDISRDDSRVRVWVIAAREDLEIARQVREAMAGTGAAREGR